ncbi:MAG: hypothetical protein WC528_01220 [Patescibacteria group bacterium]
MLDFGKNNKLSGQSLIETIIAIGLVMTVVISSITMGVYVTRLGRGSQNNLVAVNLAREGLEVVRNIRDGNWLKKSQGVEYQAGPPIVYYQWDTGLDGCSGANYCLVRPEFTTVGGFLVFDKWALHKIESPYCLPPDIQNNACRLKRAVGVNTFTIDDFHLYNHRATVVNRNIATDFYRSIGISERDLSGGRTVKATVKWRENNIDKKIILEEYLTDWRYE